MAQERLTGKVKFFNKVNAYGFITMDDGKEIFVHKNDVNGRNDLYTDDSVSFTIGEGKKGPVAKDVDVI
jgi:CspA family cold shock protein